MCVCVCVCMYIYIYKHIYIHTHTHTHTDIDRCTRQESEGNDEDKGHEEHGCAEIQLSVLVKLRVLGVVRQHVWGVVKETGVVKRVYSGKITHT